MQIAECRMKGPHNGRTFCILHSSFCIQDCFLRPLKVLDRIHPKRSVGYFDHLYAISVLDHPELLQRLGHLQWCRLHRCEPEQELARVGVKPDVAVYAPACKRLELIRNRAAGEIQREVVQRDDDLDQFGSFAASESMGTIRLTIVSQDRL